MAPSSIRAFRKVTLRHILREDVDDAEGREDV